MAADLTKSFSKLTSATERLKEDSERLNAVINGVQEQLRQIDPGVTIWLEDVEDLLLRRTERASLRELAERLPFGKVTPAFIDVDGYAERFAGYQLGWTRI